MVYRAPVADRGAAGAAACRPVRFAPAGGRSRRNRCGGNFPPIKWSHKPERGRRWSVNIAVCENSAAAAEQMRNWIGQYCRLYHVPAVLECFPSAAAFSARGGRFDIVYLCTGGSTGFFQARQLRERDSECRIILVDGHPGLCRAGHAPPLHRFHPPPGGIPPHCPQHESGAEGSDVMAQTQIKRRRGPEPETQSLEQGAPPPDGLGLRHGAVPAPGPSVPCDGVLSADL